MFINVQHHCQIILIREIINVQKSKSLSLLITDFVAHNTRVIENEDYCKGPCLLFFRSAGMVAHVLLNSPILYLVGSYIIYIL